MSGYEMCAKEFLLKKKKQAVNCIKNPNVFAVSYKICGSVDRNIFERWHTRNGTQSNITVININVIVIKHVVCVFLSL